jgi:Ca2+-binding EF-hand superfamily protein
MNVSQASGSSAAWMLQRLFQSSGETTTTSTAESTGRQKLPGADSQSCNTSGASSAPKMSGDTLSAMVSMQMGAPPGASEVASDLVSSLDTNGDGEVSADEIATAFSAAGIDTSRVETALKAIDADSSGTLNADELATAISSDMQAHAPKGPPPSDGMGGPPPGDKPQSANDAASSLLTAFDSNKDSSHSIDEILKALGQDSDTDGIVASVFSSLDADGDGQINLAELTSAIQSNMNAGNRAYAESASLTG